ncbi:uncharacterized protein KY384_002127 [Bacidia gigantensis]|uniref:uncharacterized protein n=1 Tax=Bacidia gigantensis TaxID=2732470 RepID=UPI001D03A821|nr:uncharacterized protein KY384_002127 [Bacidia gigantensis]KAG8533344.1 hypothetical protein KY384_002127 [Bacidia gigantensis]
MSKLHVEIEFHRFPQITNNTVNDISMPKWKSICKAIANLPSLTDLEMTLLQKFFGVEVKGAGEASELMVGVLLPLKQIRPKGGRERYQVRLGWRLDEDARKGLGECPFRIVKLREERRRHVTPTTLEDLIDEGGGQFDASLGDFPVLGEQQLV